MRNVVITGGLGLLGKRISAWFAGGCLKTGPVRLFVVDQAAEPGLDRSYVVGHHHHRLHLGSMVGKLSSVGDETQRTCISYVRGDLGNAEVSTAIKRFCSSSPSRTDGADHVDPELSIFHLASVMSGQGEDDFDRALSVNIDGEFMRSAGSGGKTLGDVAGHNTQRELHDMCKTLPSISTRSFAVWSLMEVCVVCTVGCGRVGVMFLVHEQLRHAKMPLCQVMSQ